MKFFNSTQLTGTILAALACASFAGCSRNGDQANSYSTRPGASRSLGATQSSTTPGTVNDTSAGTTSGTSNATNGTTSNTTVAANDDTATAPADTTSAPPVGPDDSTTKTDTSTTTTKSTKHSKSKHKAKKHHAKHGSAMATPAHRAHRAHMAKQDRAVIYDEPSVATTGTNSGSTNSANSSVSNSSQNQSVTNHDFDDTVSATTMAAPGWQETGLSPFAQEPASRVPVQIGSGQLTGEDRSTTVFDQKGLFQDPAALERGLIR